MRRFCVILLALVIISGIPYTADAVTIQKNITAGIENEREDYKVWFCGYIQPESCRRRKTLWV